MLTNGKGKQVAVTRHTPPDGHSISTASTPNKPFTGHTTNKGRKSTGGASSDTLAENPAYIKFKAFKHSFEGHLQKSTQRDQLIERLQKRLDALDAYLSSDEELFKLFEGARLRDLVLMEGIYIDKLQALSGHATTIIGVQQQRKIDELTPALTQLLKERGLKVTAQERTLEFQTP